MRTKSTRRLYLPGGGSFDIQLDDVIENAPLAGSDFAGASPSWTAIAAGAALGGFLTWALLRWTRA